MPLLNPATGPRSGPVASEGENKLVLRMISRQIEEKTTFSGGLYVKVEMRMCCVKK